jgi:hypothetical protein
VSPCRIKRGYPDDDIGDMSTTLGASNLMGARIRTSWLGNLGGNIQYLLGSFRQRLETTRQVACRRRNNHIREQTGAHLYADLVMRCLPLLLSLSVSTPILPLQRFEQRGLFSIFVLDIGVCVEVLCFFLVCGRQILGNSREKIF